MRKILIIGVGAGDPDYITVQAIKALNRVDVFFVIDKGAAKDDLVALRKEICERHITGSDYRFVEARDPERDRTPPDSAAYQAAVKGWHDDRAALFEAMISSELGPDGCGAFLVWGAYLGTPDELLIAGPVTEVGPQIERVRAEARARKGWIMDTYLLRRPHPATQIA